MAAEKPKKLGKRDKKVTFAFPLEVEEYCDVDSDKKSKKQRKKQKVEKNEGKDQQEQQS